MTEKKICPIMSRAKQGDAIINTRFGSGPEPLYRSEDEMREYGWWPVDGIPFSNLIPCLKESCMAWVPETYGCTNAGNTQFCSDIDGDTCCTTCTGFAKYIRRGGYYKLIGEARP